MAEETQYSANTGLVSLATANPNLDGTGTMQTVLTAASNGTLVKSVWIKGGTKNGMVRLFIYDGTNAARLVAEIEICAATPICTVNYQEKRLPLDLHLECGYVLKASTDQADPINVIAEGLDWCYYASSVRSDTTKYTATTGTTLISAANSNIDGTGTLGTVLTAAADPSKGCKINSITIKATGNTSPGMVRLFMFDGASKTKLFAEIEVPATIRSYAAKSFSHTLFFENGFYIKRGFSIKASTENAESFVVSAEGDDFDYEA
jgi:hypothetical protein